MLHERLKPDDRVVAPVVRFAKLPEMQARGEQRPIDAVGELLHARIQGIAADCARRGLDDAGVRAALPSSAPALSGIRQLITLSASSTTMYR